MDHRAVEILERCGFTNIVPLGSGAFSTVFRCESPDGEPVAAKVAFDEKGIRAAQREAEALQAIAPHKNIIKLISASFTNAASMLVMPLMSEGDSLQLLLGRRCVGLPEEDARGLFLQLIDAVDHIHKLGFVHRDIKCENILLGGADRRELKLADLGFASRWKRGNHLKEMFGSPHYSAPELLQRVPYEGPEVDVWSMGVVLYAWTAGRLPFGGKTDLELQRNILYNCCAYPLTYSHDLEDLLFRIFQSDPAKRITMEQMRAHRWVVGGQPEGIRRNISQPPESAVPIIALSSKPSSPRSNRTSSLPHIPRPPKPSKFQSAVQLVKRIAGPKHA